MQMLSYAGSLPPHPVLNYTMIWFR